MSYFEEHGLGGVDDVLEAGMDLARDPALIEASCLLVRLSDVIEGDKPGPPCKRHVYRNKSQGIGLAYAVGPIRAITTARQHPYFAGAVVVGLVGTIFLAGYLLGCRR